MSSGSLVACVRVRKMGEGGQTFVILVRTYKVNDLLSVKAVKKFYRRSNRSFRGQGSNP